MLAHLTIRNFAIIESLDLLLHPGLNVLTGETGAGKSIILNAAHLLLGGRPSSDSIRDGEDFMEVESLFSGAESALEGAGEDSEFVVRRVIFKNGRNRVYLDGKLATVGVLQERVPRLLSIVSQYDHEMLLHREFHQHILDEYGALMGKRRQVEERFHRLEALQRQRRNYLRQRTRRQERKELLEFQLKEMEDAGIEPGEDERLSREREKIRHAALLYEKARGAYGALYENEGSLLEILHHLEREVQEMERVDPELKSLHDRLRSAAIELEDIAMSLHDYAERQIYDPDRLDAVEQRIHTLERLKRKYGPLLSDVLERKVRTREELHRLEREEIDVAELEAEIRRAEQELVEAAANLSAARKAHADTLARKVEEELRTLNMPHLVFKVEFGRLSPEDKGVVTCGEWTVGPTGSDAVEFAMAANPGEPLRPLNKIASGGELSRILLAVKRILARAGSVETLVFDEVDAGIGGSTAELVGKKLKEISRFTQVLCITHLPQIACFADHHYRVYKEPSGRRMVTRVKELDEEERISEIARMLGGREEDEVTRTYARRMLERFRGS